MEQIRALPDLSSRSAPQLVFQTKVWQSYNCLTNANVRFLHLARYLLWQLVEEMHSTPHKRLVSPILRENYNFKGTSSRPGLVGERFQACFRKLLLPSQSIVHTRYLALNLFALKFSSPTHSHHITHRRQSLKIDFTSSTLLLPWYRQVSVMP